MIYDTITPCLDQLVAEDHLKYKRIRQHSDPRSPALVDAQINDMKASDFVPAIGYHIYTACYGMVMVGGPGLTSFGVPIKDALRRGLATIKPAPNN